MDRSRLWRAVAHDYEQVRDVAPAGYEAYVEVFLAGRNEPVEIGRVETSSDPDHPWIRLDSSEGRDPDGTFEADDCWMHVHEARIERVEVKFRRVGEKRLLGFTHRLDPAQPEATA